MATLDVFAIGALGKRALQACELLADGPRTAAEIVAELNLADGRRFERYHLQGIRDGKAKRAACLESLGIVRRLDDGRWQLVATDTAFKRAGMESGATRLLERRRQKYAEQRDARRAAQVAYDAEHRPALPVDAPPTPVVAPVANPWSQVDGQWMHAETGECTPVVPITQSRGTGHRAPPPPPDTGTPATADPLATFCKRFAAVEVPA